MLLEASELLQAPPVQDWKHPYNGIEGHPTRAIILDVDQGDHYNKSAQMAI